MKVEFIEFKEFPTERLKAEFIHQQQLLRYYLKLKR
jgi:hypothetical protein